ncbi:MAG: hypothetical protein EHM45_09870 [Desulfobacteraceae bacterium]|nr:MAG: hypothetical protein EHM45_09870 [Desulfobacteraceae bacterium]
MANRRKTIKKLSLCAICLAGLALSALFADNILFKETLRKVAYAAMSPWTRFYNSSLFDIGYGIAVDNNHGDVYITGTQGSNKFLARYEPAGAGKLVWETGSGAGAEDFGSDIVIAENNDVYYTGMAGFDDRAIFVEGWNQDNERLFITYLNGDHRDVAKGIALDSNNNIYITGYSYSSSLYGSKNHGDFDAILIKLDESGTRKWAKMIGGPEDDQAYDIAVDKYDNIYIVGATKSPVFNGENGYGDFDIFISKYDADGNHQWTQLRGSSGHERAFGVAIDPSYMDEDYNLYVTGFVESANFDYQTCKGLKDVVLMKYVITEASDDSQQIEWRWTRFAGGTKKEYGNGVAADSHGVFVVGTTHSSFGGQTVKGKCDAFILKYTPAGKWVKTKFIGGSGSDWGQAICADTNGNYSITGYTSASFDGQPYEGRGDAFVSAYHRFD